MAMGLGLTSLLSGLLGGGGGTGGGGGGASAPTPAPSGPGTLASLQASAPPIAATPAPPPGTGPPTTPGMLPLSPLTQPAAASPATPPASIGGNLQSKLASQFGDQSASAKSVGDDIGLTLKPLGSGALSMLPSSNPSNSGSWF